MHFGATLKLFLGTASLAAALWGCGDLGSNLFIMSDMHQVEPSGSGPAGFSCQDISQGNGSASMGEPGNDFWMREVGSDRGLAVVIGTQNQELAHRFYDRDFIESRRVDRFAITTEAGVRYEFVYWGGDSCERTPPPLEGGAVQSEGTEEEPTEDSATEDSAIEDDAVGGEAIGSEAFVGDAGTDAQATPVLE